MIIDYFGYVMNAGHCLVYEQHIRLLLQQCYNSKKIKSYAGL